jgi:hypothetical protein
VSIDPADELRHAASALRGTADARPEDFGLTPLSADALMARADAHQPPVVRRGVRWAATAGLIAAAASVVFVAPRLSGHELPAAIAPTQDHAPLATAAPAYADAHDLLLAAAASSAGARGAASSAYWHVKSVQHLPEGDVPRELWIGRESRSILKQEGDVIPLPAARFSLESTSITWDELLALPANVPELRALLAARVSEGAREPGYATFKLVGDLLAESPAGPRLRAALWRVLATLPDVTSLGRVSDAEGRPGWMIRFSSATVGRIDYVLDPATGMLLEVRHRPADRARGKWSIVYLESDGTDRIPFGSPSH